MINNFWKLASGYWLIAIILTIYSYSQIDLNLTLSSNPIYQQIQNKLIQLGYFNRPLSAVIFLILILLFFLFYSLFIKEVMNKKLDKTQLIILILVTSGILLLSYPAFSHDIFNYIFDARILSYYQNNPYLKTALDYPNDNWTRFMHWTHRTYPYGPFWLVFTVLPYLFSFGKFVLALFNFKLLLNLAYLGSSYLMYRIGGFNALVLFAFNPLVIFESLVSPHIEILMTFFGLFGIFLITRKQKIWGSFSLVLSVLTKYTTLSYLPIIFIKNFSFLAMMTLLTIIAQIYLREILPWYFIPFLAMTFLSNNQLLKYLAYALSISGAVYYLPYLYIGEMNYFVKDLRLILFFIPLCFSIFYYFISKK